MITAVLKQTIDDEVLTCVESFSLESQPTPGLQELRHIAEIRQFELWLLILYENDSCVALFPGFIEQRQIYGIKHKVISCLGYTLFDYNRFYCKADYLEELIQQLKIFSKKDAIDAVLFDNIPYFSQSDKISSSHIETSEVLIFDACLSDNGFDYILKKKKLRKHYERIVRRYEYDCVTKIGDLSEVQLDELADFHKERWAFDHVQSAFYDPLRIQEYVAYPANKVVTRITINGELLAIHYGMVYGNTVLFHTPIINIKYLDDSPLQILLYEMAKMCNEKGFTTLDFGLGDESYKDRYCNSQRVLFHLHIPLSLKAKFAKCCLKTFSINKPKLHNLIGDLKVIKHRLRSIFTTIHYFEHKGEAQDITNDGLIFQIFTDYRDFVDGARKVGFEIIKVHYERFRAGDNFYLLSSGDNVLCSGWGSKNAAFYASEIDKCISNDNKIMLYDFVTPETERRKGYYVKLLGNIVISHKHENLAIFTEKNNQASSSAILKAGFTPSTPLFLHKKNESLNYQKSES